MKKLKELFHSLYLESAEAQENLSEREALSLLLEAEGLEYKPFLQTELSDEKRSVILKRAKRVFDGYPLQYEIGFAYFYRSRFLVREGVLIPRRDSEVLVETAIKLIPENSHFLDLCTGSGCLGLSVLSERGDTTATLVDISDTALETARENAEALGLLDRVDFMKLDILKSDLSTLPPHSALIMNPPYLTGDEMKKIPENVSHEPSLALFGGEDGLIFYKRIFEERDKLASLMIFEIGEKQANDLLKIWSEGEIIRDYTCHDRVFLKK